MKIRRKCYRYLIKNANIFGEVNFYLLTILGLGMNTDIKKTLIGWLKNLKFNKTILIIDGKAVILEG